MATKVKLIADGVITPDQITLTTASTGTNTTAPATTAFVQQEISALVDSSPDALNTLNELAAALGDDANFSTTVTNSIATKLPLAGGTLTGDLNFGDNDKAVFGAGSDLQIYHTGGASVIQDSGDGSLFLQGESQIVLGNVGNAESYAVFNTDGAVQLRHNNLQKFTTTSTGIDVTGTVTADGLTIDTDANSKFTIADGGTDAITLYGGSGDELYIGANAAYKLRFKTDGNIVMDNGGSFGIGLPSPSHILDVESDEDTWISKIYNTGSDANAQGLLVRSDATVAHNASVFGVYADSAYRLVVKSSGNVGIGTTNPSEKLHIGGTAPGDSIIRQDATSSGTNWEIGERVAGKYQFWEDDGDNVRLTIMSTGNVGIGTDNPSERLEVDGVVEINRTGDHPAIRFSESDTVRGYIGSGDWAINGGADDDFGISASSSGDLLLGTTAGVERMRITSNTIQLNGGNQSYSNNQRVLSESENISWSSSTSAQSWTSSNYLPYQKFVEAALHFGYVGNGAISQHFYLSLLNNFTGLSIQTIQSSSGNSGSSYHTISFTSTGAYNSRRIVVQNTPAGGQNTANLNGTIYYGFAR